ncbi:MAG: hypothetical protein RL308_255 [Bacteroidota bacterium]|jgi:hypothetical protein
MILYKYRNFTETSKKRTLEIINKQELFFAGIESFNDPFDGKVHLRFDGKRNEIIAAQTRTQYTMNLKKEDKYEGITFEAAHKLVSENVTEEFISNRTEIEARIERIQKIHNQKGVLALSSKNDNILMWSHYTFNHKGVCFGFEFDADPIPKPKRVKYQTHYDDIWGWLYTDEEIVDRILYSKSVDWEYEDEHRIVVDAIRAETFLPDSLKEIVFGTKMSQEDKLEIINECEKSGLSPEFKQAVLDVELFKINIEEYEA